MGHLRAILAHIGAILGPSWPKWGLFTNRAKAVQDIKESQDHLVPAFGPLCRAPGKSKNVNIYGKLRAGFDCRGKFMIILGILPKRAQDGAKKAQ